MECYFCGKTLDKGDMLARSCQKCGEELMPDDIAKLENELGIVREAPEVEAPVLMPEGGIKIPDMMECKNCGVPLYLDELKSYMNGGDCAYCGVPDPDAAVQEASPEPPVDAKPDSEVEEVPQQIIQSISVPENGILVRLCTGPLAGESFKLPIDEIIGREFFSKIIKNSVHNYNAESFIDEQGSITGSTYLTNNTGVEPSEEWYAKSLSRVSREHFKISEDGTIEDMGSANGTFLDREEIFGQGDAFELGMVLSIADEIMLTRVHEPEDGPGMRICHKQTGIVIDVPADKMFHLGRLREDGRREPFAFALEDQMTRIDGMNHEDLLRISRRHAIIWVDHELGLSVENIDGKEVIIDDWDGIRTQLGPENTSVFVGMATNCSDKVTVGKMKFVISRNS